MTTPNVVKALKMAQMQNKLQYDRNTDPYENAMAERINSIFK